MIQRPELHARCTYVRERDNTLTPYASIAMYCCILLSALPIKIRRATTRNPLFPSLYQKSWNCRHEWCAGTSIDMEDRLTLSLFASDAFPHTIHTPDAHLSPPALYSRRGGRTTAYRRVLGSPRLFYSKDNCAADADADAAAAAAAAALGLVRQSWTHHSQNFPGIFLYTCRAGMGGCILCQDDLYKDTSNAKQKH